MINAHGAMTKYSNLWQNIPINLTVQGIFDTLKTPEFMHDNVMETFNSQSLWQYAKNSIFIATRNGINGASSNKIPRH